VLNRWTEPPGFIANPLDKTAPAIANRIAGQITLLSLAPNAAKAQTYFECALMVARKQQAAEPIICAIPRLQQHGQRICYGQKEITILQS
jgi:hypothetical protein